MDEISGILEDLKAIEDVSTVYLFGSQVKGRAGPISDIDICVLAPKGVGDATRERIKCNSSKRVDLSLFWDLPPHIRMRVIREGKVIFERDPLVSHRVGVETIRQYLDFKPVYTRHMLSSIA